MSQGSGIFYEGAVINGSTLAAAMRLKADCSQVDAITAQSRGPQGLPGPPGRDGPPGPAGLGVLVPWKASTVYSPGPLPSYVSYQGSSYVCQFQHTSTTFAADFAAGFWGTVASGTLPDRATLLAAVQSILAAPSGIASLDASARQPLAQDQIRAWQVIRAAKPVIAAAGGSWSNLLASSNASNPDATDGSSEAVQGGTPAPLPGVLSGLIATYLVTVCGQSQGQAQASLQSIWAAAASIVP